MWQLLKAEIIYNKLVVYLIYPIMMAGYTASRLMAAYSGKTEFSESGFLMGFIAGLTIILPVALLLSRQKEQRDRLHTQQPVPARKVGTVRWLYSISLLPGLVLILFLFSLFEEGELRDFGAIKIFLLSGIFLLQASLTAICWDIHESMTSGFLRALFGALPLLIFPIALIVFKEVNTSIPVVIGLNLLGLLLGPVSVLTFQKKKSMLSSEADFFTA
ncbi:MAG: hypothetical protein GY765_36825 [bacterium]|nr:hypothetical protein [bacterium]